MVNIPAPIILTLQMDKEAQQHFNDLRRQYFPAERNYLDAHITLFHQLPYEKSIGQILDGFTHQANFDMTVAQPYHTGFGVAFQLQSKKLIYLHHTLSESFQRWLIPQDRKSFQPHITIQNKVSPEESKQLTRRLQENFIPFSITAIGMHTWLYQQGPWKPLEFFPFQQTLILK